MDCSRWLLRMKTSVGPGCYAAPPVTRPPCTARRTSRGTISRRCARSSVDRAPDFGSGGRGFESLRARHRFTQESHLLAGRSARVPGQVAAKVAASGHGMAQTGARRSAAVRPPMGTAVGLSPGIRPERPGSCFGWSRQLAGWASSWSGASSPEPAIRFFQAVAGPSVSSSSSCHPLLYLRGNRRACPALGRRHPTRPVSR